MGKNQGSKGKEPIQEKRWTHAGWAKAAFSVDEGSLGGKKASIGRYQIALESFLSAEWQMMRPVYQRRFVLFSFVGSGNEGAMLSFPMTRQLIIALIVVFVSVMGAQAQPGDVAKALMELENAWVDALVKADTAKLDAILVDTYSDTDEL